MASAINVLKQAGSKFMEDDAMTRAAGVAFYAALSMAPILLLFVAIVGMLGVGSQERMVEAVTAQVGPQAGKAIEQIATGAEPGAGSWWSMGISIATLLFSASLVFVALQTSLNRIWNVKQRSAQGMKGGATQWVRTRLTAMGMVLMVGLLLLVFMAADAVIAAVIPGAGWIWLLASLAVTAAVATVLFAMIFRYLPDVHIEWRDVWTGAAVTALLFGIGKYGIGLYLGHVGVGSMYGAAGSLIAMLLWIYFSAIIVFFGAEITQAYARGRDARIEPNENAVRFREIEVEAEGDAVDA